MGIVVRMVSVGLLVFGCAVAPTPSPTCPSPVVDRGGGWLEVGGPRAWLLYDPAYPAYHANPRGARRLWVRVEEAFAGEALTLVGRPAAGPEVEGFVYGRWAGSGPPPDLGGVVFFAALPLAEPGCWEIIIGTDDEQLGSALIDVQPLPPESPSPES